MTRIISLNDIQAARKRLDGIVLKTTCEFSKNVTKYIGVKTYLKFENQQLTGSFKIRGAYNKISLLSLEQRKKGVSACSAGNHAQGVAYSATKLGIKSHIVMPMGAPLAKVEATRAYGATVYQNGQVFDDAYDYCMILNKKKRL